MQDNTAQTNAQVLQCPRRNSNRCSQHQSRQVIKKKFKK